MDVGTQAPTDIPSELHVPAGRWHDGLWVSDAPLTEFEAYWRCVDGFPGSGLWPLLVPVDTRFPPWELDWFQRERSRAATAAEVNQRDAAAVLAAAWRGEQVDAAWLAPVGAHFPGLVRRAPAKSRVNAHGELIWNAIEIASSIETRLGLVRVSAVLRSWEDRFAARLLLLGANQLILSVTAAPTTPFRAVAVAAEHRAFCPDEFDRLPVPFATIAAELIDDHVWGFWWD